MMIDYVTLMLANMAAGLVVLALFLWTSPDWPETKHWAPAFAISGLVATVSGFAMAFTWPIPAPYSMAYSEMSVLLGVLFLGAAWALAAGWKLLPLGYYAFLPGLAAILLGIRIIHLSLTGSPIIAGVGFILTGLGGVGAALTLRRPDIWVLRRLGALVMLAAAAIWVLTGFMAYWMHMVPAQS